jgi:hypothetical protein
LILLNREVLIAIGGSPVSRVQQLETKAASPAAFNKRQGLRGGRSPRRFPASCSAATAKSIHPAHGRDASCAIDAQ